MFAYAKTKTQISFAVTAKLISAFVFATRIVQSLYFLNPKFQAPSYLLLLCSLVCVRPGRKPRRPVFSERGSYDYTSYFYIRNLASAVAQVGLSSLLRFSRDEALILTSKIAQCHVPILKLILAPECDQHDLRLTVRLQMAEVLSFY